MITTIPLMLKRTGHKTVQKESKQIERRENPVPEKLRPMARL